MANYNAIIKKRKGDTWDNIYPMTLAENVMLDSSTNAKNKFERLAIAIQEEVDARINGDTELENMIVDATENIMGYVNQEVNVVKVSLTDEISNRENADEVLQENIDNLDVSLKDLINKKSSIYKTINDLKQGDVLTGSIYMTSGFHTVGDGGGASYLISDTGVEDGFSVIKLNSDKFAILLVNGFVNVKKCGLKGDGVTDETVLMQKILNKYKDVYFPSGNYLISESMYLQSGSRIKGESRSNTTLMCSEYSMSINGFSADYLSDITISDFNFKHVNFGVHIRAVTRDNELPVTQQKAINDVYIERCSFDTRRFAVFLLGVDRFRVNDIELNQLRTSTYSNRDGIHLTACRNGVVSNIIGTTDDDMVAILADDQFSLDRISQPTAYGDCRNIIVENVISRNRQEFGDRDGTYAGIKLLSTFSRVDDIIIRNCILKADYTGALNFVNLFDSLGVKADEGYIGNVTVEGCHFIKDVSNYNSPIVLISTSFENLTFNDCVFELKKDVNNYRGFNIERNCTIKNLNINNCVYANKATTARPFFTIRTGARIDNFNVNGLGIQQLFHANVFEINSDATIGVIDFANINCNKIGIFLSVQGNADVIMLNNIRARVQDANFITLNAVCNEIFMDNIRMMYGRWLLQVLKQQTDLQLYQTNIYLTNTYNNLRTIEVATELQTNIRFVKGVMSTLTPQGVNGDSYIHAETGVITHKIYSGGSWKSLAYSE